MLTMDGASLEGWSILPRLRARLLAEPIGWMDETECRAERYRDAVMRHYISHGRTISSF